MSIEFKKGRRSLAQLQSSIENNNKRIDCPGCGKVPFCSIHSISPFLIKMVCHICKTEWIKRFVDIKQDSNNSPFIHPTSGFCIYHKEQRCQYYCQDCNNNYCNLCKDEDEDHKTCKNIIKLSDLPQKQDFAKKIKEAKDYISYVTHLQSVCILRLKDQIIKIESFFNDYKAINSLIIEFTELLQDNYNRNDYSSIINLVNNTKFKLQHINEHQTNKDIMKDLAGNFILSSKPESFEFPESQHKISVLQALKFHNEEIRAICLLSERRIASASKDKTIRIINLIRNCCDIVINEHTSAVVSLIKLNNGNLVSSSVDKTIKIFEIRKNSYSCISTLFGHTNGVCKVINLNSEFFASASADNKIKIWTNQYPYENLRTLIGHKGCIFSIIKLKASNTIVSASASTSKGGDSTIKFWCFETEFPENTVNDVDCCNNNSLVEVKENILLVGSAYMELYLIDAVVRNIIRVIKCSFLADSLFAIDNCALIGNNYGGILFFDINDTSPIAVNKIHDNAVNDIINDGSHFISCSKDKTIRIWDVKKL